MRKIICCIVGLVLTGFISEMEGKIPKELRQPEDSSSSLLAVSFGPLKAFSEKLNKKVSISVLFVKLEPSEYGNEPQMIASNYSENGRAYLINAKPGKYAAVALLARIKKSGIGIGIGGGGVTSFYSYNDTSKATFFSRQIVDRSTIEVKPGEFAFMGDFTVYKQPDITKGDSAQERYYHQFVELVEKGDPALAKVKVKKKKFKKKPKRSCNRGVLTDYFSLDMTSFLRIKSDFRGTGWNDIIQKRWQEVLDKKEEDTD